MAPVNDLVLPGNLVLRTARPSDADEIARLLTERGDAADGIDARLVIDDHDAGPEAMAVVVDGTQVVSTISLLDETVTVAQGSEAVSLPAGVIELVATAREYEGRGLLRALMGWAHERSARQGHVLQVIIGIPYLYRRFGYSYALRMPPRRRLRSDWRPSAAVSAVNVRPATLADIPVLAALQDATQLAAGVRMPHSSACWRWLLARTGTVQLIAEIDGEPVGAARSTPPEDDIVEIGEIAALTPEGAEALLQFAVRAADEVSMVHADERVGSLSGTVVSAASEPIPHDDRWYYVRVPDAGGLLDALRPVLSARLTGAADIPATGTALISLYDSSLTFPWAHGEVGPIATGGVLQAPVSAGGSGVPPDAFARLVLGDGALAVEKCFPDANLGRQREFMAALFPPQRADLLTFYLP
jgi:predicted N-acetyltransferase YhbS